MIHCPAMPLQKLPRSGPKTAVKNFRATHSMVEALNRLNEILERPKVGIVEELLFRERDEPQHKGPWVTKGIARKTQISFTFSEAAVKALAELAKRHGVTPPDIIEVLVERELGEQLALLRKTKR